MKHSTDGVNATPTLQKFTCGVGHVINDLWREMAFSYTLIFMLKVAELTGTQAGLIMLICQLTDSFTGPVIGYCSDKLSLPLLAPCVGRRKAWHLLGTIVMTLFFSLMFTRCLICTESSDGLKFAYYAVIFVIVNMGFPAVDISHLAIIAAVAKTQDECVTLNALRCVMKMDHHCPWINNCVGHRNLRSFTLFLFFVPIGCCHATVIMVCCVINEFYFETGTLYYRRYPRAFPFGVNHLIAVLFCIGLSIGVTIAVGILLFYQVKGVLCNESAIESWIVEKADRERDEGEVFIYPYNLGWWENTKQVLSLTQDYVGDGLVWSVVQGCDQFTLTREQLAQKILKRERTVPYRIVRDYNGWVFTCSHGCRTCVATPCTEEPRMKVARGDTIWVTRWRRYWFYGGKTSQDVALNQVPARYQEKGWFPARCAETIDENEMPKKDR